MPKKLDESDEYANGKTSQNDGDEELSSAKISALRKVKREQSAQQDATLQNASFYPKQAFWVKDFIKTEHGKRLKKHSLKTGHKW